MPVVIAVILLVVLAGIVLVGASRRRDRGAAGLSREARGRDRSNPVLTTGSDEASSGREVEAAAAAARSGSDLAVVESAPPVPFVAPDPANLGVTRRQFFNRSIVGMMGFGLSGFGAACLAFLWPQGVSGFGSKIRVGNLIEVFADIETNNGFLYKPEGRMWITAYPNGSVEKARAAYSPAELAGMTAGVEQGFDSGVMALYQKCPHLGCRVPNCVSSQWFECPCHGSQYNQVGEKRGGPAPRGMDRFAVSVDGGVLVVDTGTIVQGPPIGTNTTGQEAEGPHCMGEAGGH
ncbi:MAG: Rieske 2Fe-2S domain-containing protein [Acidimicrobiales bacterium]|nr:Rieske 2Fe-2S domain-containing protein [Acidimicrobiales bacterium]